MDRKVGAFPRSKIGNKIRKRMALIGQILASLHPAKKKTAHEACPKLTAHGPVLRVSGEGPAENVWVVEYQIPSGSPTASLGLEVLILAAARARKSGHGALRRLKFSTNWI